MRDLRPSGSVEGVMSNRDPYSDFKNSIFPARQVGPMRIDGQCSQRSDAEYAESANKG